MYNTLQRLERRIYLFLKRLNLKNKNISIISNNCCGGVICHDLNIPFNSPTINTMIRPEEYIRFLKNLDYYLQQPVIKTENTDFPYPSGLIGDITVYFGHGISLDQDIENWNRRKLRIDKNNLFILMTDRDGCTYDTIKKFDSLVYPNKVILTHKQYPEFDSAVYIPGFEDNSQVGILTDWKPTRLMRRGLDDFDYIYYLNKASKNKGNNDGENE